MFKYKWDYYKAMLNGKYLICKVDKKGRIQLPLMVREEAGMYGQVALHQEKSGFKIMPLPKLGDPLKFLTTINIKTKKNPVEMKREAEGVFES